MANLFRCVQGHRWEEAVGNDGSSPPVCPSCGSEAVETVQSASAVTSGEAIDPNRASMAETVAPTTVRVHGMSTSVELPVIPGYNVLRELGRGGMGVVFHARHRVLDRVVAIKMIVDGTLASAEQIGRFFTEAQAVARLQHPNIVQIHEVGNHEGRPFLAFEFVDGGSLEGRFAKGPAPLAEVAGIMATLARAIHAAHERGIIHRDLKPANVLLTADGTPKISDFGLAKRIDTSAGQTQTGVIMGTPSYMSPEQAAGRKDIGPPTDIYALGAMLYDFITGRPPHVGDTGWDTVTKVVSEEPTPPSQLREGLPRDLETICMKCLEKDPARRYASAAALADDLERFLKREPLQARPISRSERAFRWVRRHPVATLSGMLAAAGVVLVVVLAHAWRLESERRQARDLARPYDLPIPAGLAPPPVPGDNLLTLAKIDLGKQLFFDKRLSVDNTIACASCHDPNRGYSGGQRFSVGVHEQNTTRRAPTLLNTAYGRFFFWDGRAPSLEIQCLMPVVDASEMGMPGLSALEEKLNKIAGYREQFQKVFGTDVTAANVAKAISCFERTLLAGNSPYDRYQLGDKTALSDAAQRGLRVFFNEGHCSACHAGANFSDGAFHNIGIGMDAATPDIGRQAVHRLAGNRGSFKTPTLRDVARSAPYMHDGSLKALEDVVEYYARGGNRNPQLDEEIFPLKLSPQQKQDLITFLREGLANSEYPLVEAPSLPAN